MIWLLCGAPLLLFLRRTIALPASIDRRLVNIIKKPVDMADRPAGTLQTADLMRQKNNRVQISLLVRLEADDT
jgi:hypothetical protein